jgi:hypothetical protein
LKVSVAGLGCGGASRLGMRGDGGAENHAVRLIKQALDLGVNFLDTAQNYGTEGVVGKAIAGTPRDRVVLSTKKTLPTPDEANPETAIIEGVEKSLKLLGTDYIDIYHLHGVEPKDYEFARLFSLANRVFSRAAIAAHAEPARPAAAETGDANFQSGFTESGVFHFLPKGSNVQIVKAVQIDRSPPTRLQRFELIERLELFSFNSIPPARRALLRWRK